MRYEIDSDPAIWIWAGITQTIHGLRAEGERSLKLIGSILNITFIVMTCRVSYKDVANKIAPGNFSEPVAP
jgi:hypothetical protein